MAAKAKVAEELRAAKEASAAAAAQAAARLDAIMGKRSTYKVTAVPPPPSELQGAGAAGRRAATRPQQEALGFD